MAVLNLAGPGGVTAPGGLPVISTGVMVIYADDVSFTFMTPEGHPMAELIAGYREPSDVGKREKIEDLGRRDEHVHAILSALRAGMLNSYKDALEEMVIMLAEKSALYEKQLMQLRGTLLSDMTSPLGVFIGNQGEQHKPDPL